MGSALEDACLPGCKKTTLLDRLWQDSGALHLAMFHQWISLIQASLKYSIRKKTGSVKSYSFLSDAKTPAAAMFVFGRS
jgi:hypothetical protein